jgi:cytochrome c
MRKRLPFLFLLALVSGATPSLAQPAGRTSDPGQGRDLAERLCSRCHAVGRTGTSPMPEAPPFRALKERYPVEALAEALAEGMTTGHEDMPEIQLPPAAIDSFIAYLDQL